MLGCGGGLAKSRGGRRLKRMPDSQLGRAGAWPDDLFLCVRTVTGSVAGPAGGVFFIIGFFCSQRVLCPKANLKPAPPGVAQLGARIALQRMLSGQSKEGVVIVDEACGRDDPRGPFRLVLDNGCGRNSR